MTALEMNRGATAPRWIKIAAGIGAVWYAFGLMQFWLAYTVDASAAVTSGAMTEAHAAAVIATPGAVWAAFALASFLGLVGCVFLLRGLAMASIAFGASLACALVYYVWVYGLSGTGWDRPSEEIVIGFVVVLVTFGFFTLSRRV